MTLATAINIAVIVLCVCVLLQMARMSRRMRAFRESELTAGVEQFEAATDQARAVLGELKQVLSTEGVEQAQLMASAQEMRDELSVMVGIGNSVADRIMKAAEEATKITEAAPKKPATRTAKAAGEEKAAPKPRTRKPRTTKASVAKAAEDAANLDANAEAEKLVAEILGAEMVEAKPASVSRVPARSRTRRKVLTGKAKPAANDVSDDVVAAPKQDAGDESAVA